MIVNRMRIENLITKVQDAFLDTPGLTLGLKDVEGRFGVDEMTCSGVMTALVDAKVLARNRNGAYVRFFPGRAGVPIRSVRAYRKPAPTSIRPGRFGGRAA